MNSLLCCLFPRRRRIPASIQSSRSDLLLVQCIVCSDEVEEESCVFCSNCNTLTEKHAHCFDCVGVHARAKATSSNQDSIGLKCWDKRCNNILLWRNHRRPSGGN